MYSQRRIDFAKSQPDNAQATMDLAVGHFKRAQVLARTDRVDDAIPAFETARTILRRMAEADPSNTTSCTGAAEVSGEMGRVLFQAGRLAAALPELTAYTTEMEHCMSDDKMVAVMREQLAEGHHRRGRAFLSLPQSKNAKPEQMRVGNAEGCAALRRAAMLYESLDDDESRVPPELRSELEKCTVVHGSE